MRSYFAAITLALALANAAPAQPRAITHVTVITGTGAPPTPNQTILIEAGRITAVFNTGSQPIPTNTHVIELKGHYVIPGLIDTHVHVATEGMRVWSHSTAFPATPLDAVDAGVDVLSHAAILYWAGANDVPNRYAARAVRAAYDSVDVDGPVMRDLFARMRAAGTVLDATLFVAARLETAPPGTSGFADPRRAIQWMYDATRAAHRAGVTVAAGTDGMLPGGDTEPPNIHREMELLVTRAGFTPLDAITAATRGSARALGALDSLGTIEKGKLADLVVLSADPTMDIRNSRRITLVLKGGEVHSPLTPPARR